MQMMTISGAKGTSVNVSQISCCLGKNIFNTCLTCLEKEITTEIYDLQVNKN